MLWIGTLAYALFMPLCADDNDDDDDDWLVWWDCIAFIDQLFNYNNICVIQNIQQADVSETFMELPVTGGTVLLYKSSVDVSNTDVSAPVSRALADETDLLPRIYEGR